MDRIESDLLSAEVDAGLDVVDHIAVGPDDLLDGVHDVIESVLLAVEDEVYAHDLASVHQSLDVVLEPENRRSLGGLVNPDALEDTGAIVHGMGEDMDLRIRPIDEFSIQPYLLCLVHCVHLGICLKSIKVRSVP